MTDYSSLSFEAGRHLRSLRVVEARNYQPKHDGSSYWKFIREQMSGFHIVELHPQSQYPEVYQLFTEASQHVLGDSLAELLDKAIDKAGWRP